MIRKSFALALLSLALAAGSARAQSDLSAASALPIASVAVVGGTALSGAATLALAGGSLVVKSVQLSATGVVCVLERASDRASYSVHLATRGPSEGLLVSGAVVQPIFIGTGVVLSVAGQAIAFVPNTIGKALMHNERLSR